MERLIFGILIIFVSGCSALYANELELTEKTEGYVKGDQSVIYIYIADTTDLSNAKKAIFFPHVDSFSRLEIQNSFINFSGLTRVNASESNSTTTVAQKYIYKSSSNTTYVWAEFGGKSLNLTTVPKRYGLGEYLLASYSVVVQLTKGVPTAISWDDGCSDCNTTEGQCIDNSCGITFLECLTCDSCVSNGTNSSVWQTCNIKMYVGFIGTDADSRPMTSGGSLPSNFTKFSLVSSFRTAAGTISDSISSLFNSSSNSYDPRFDSNVNDPTWYISS